MQILWYIVSSTFEAEVPRLGHHVQLLFVFGYFLFGLVRLVLPRVAQHKVHNRLLDTQQIVLMHLVRQVHNRLLMRFPELLGNQGHDILEPNAFQWSYMLRIDPIVNVIVITQNIFLNVLRIVAGIQIVSFFFGYFFQVIQSQLSFLVPLSKNKVYPPKSIAVNDPKIAYMIMSTRERRNSSRFRFTFSAVLNALSAEFIFTCFLVLISPKSLYFLGSSV